MKRFFNVFSLLMVTLLLLATGVDATLDHLANSPRENAFTFYTEKGQAQLAYSGAAALQQDFPKPVRVSAPVLHRT